MSPGSALRIEEEEKMLEQELRNRIETLKADLARVEAALSFCSNAAEDEDQDDRDCFIEAIIGGTDNIGDMLLNGFSGYWMCGLHHCRRDDGTPVGWLVEVFDDCDNYPQSHSAANQILRAWEDSNFTAPLGDLPKGVHFVDRATAIRAWEIGTKRWGEAFGDGSCDYNDWDWAIQMVLLGDCVYG